MTDRRMPIAVGERAPEMRLPAVQHDGVVALREFRGRSAVLLGLFRGLACPFCRRQIFQLDLSHDALRTAGVETVAVINTRLERARLYFGQRPIRSVLAADADAVSHRAFGVPRIELAPGAAQWPHRISVEEFMAARINPTGELDEPVAPLIANERLNARDGFVLTETDQQIAAAHGTQLSAHFLIDREGVVRWSFLEGGEGVEHLARFPMPSALLAAARALAA